TRRNPLNGPACVAPAVAVPRHAASATIAVQADTPLALSKSSISREIGAASANASVISGRFENASILLLRDHHIAASNTCWGAKHSIEFVEFSVKRCGFP